MFATERDFQNAFAALLKNNGWEVEEEVPYVNRSIDIVCVSSKRKHATIELKLRDWKKGIAQAAVLKYANELVFLAMPRKSLPTHALEEASKQGVGLILIAEDLSITLVLRPRIVGLVKDYATKWLTNSLVAKKARDIEATQNGVNDVK